jgi:hypothetical protein
MWSEKDKTRSSNVSSVSLMTALVVSALLIVPLLGAELAGSRGADAVPESTQTCG